MNLMLDGKVAVITGAGRGIGRAVAMHMAAEGAKVVVNDVGAAVDGSGADKAPADEVVAAIKEAGGIAVANYDDVAAVKDGQNIINAAMDNFGRIDVLVNNAGVYRPRLLVEMSEEDWDATMAVHLRGHFCCTKPAAVAMIGQGGGRIINMSSGASLGAAGSSNYSAAKAGILGFTRALARELGPQGIMVNAVFPLARTRMTEMADQAKRIQRPEGLGRRQTAADVAPLIVYLASDRADGINGYTFSLRHEGTIEIYSNPMMLRGIYSKDKWTADDIAAAVPNLLSEMKVPINSEVS